MIEVDEKKITAKAEKYAEKRSVHFRPLIASHTKAVTNAYIDGYVAGLLAYNKQMDPFLNDDGEDEDD